MNEQRELIDFRHCFTIVRIKSFRLPILMVFMTFLHLTEKVIQQKSHFAKKATPESENVNYQEEVINNSTLYRKCIFNCFPFISPCSCVTDQDRIDRFYAKGNESFDESMSTANTNDTSTKKPKKATTQKIHNSQ